VSATVELDQHRYLSLATFRQSGAEVATPVWFAASANRLYVFTGGESGRSSDCDVPRGRGWRRAMPAAA
jgi:hypothetical protein